MTDPATPREMPDTPDAAPAVTALTGLIRGEGRLVLATLTRLTGDLGIAEDAVQDASIAALESWRRLGVPPNPRAWLILAAKRRAIDLLRREHSRQAKEKEAVMVAMQRAPDEFPDEVVHDDQLRLIFTCCHPALAQETQVALSLRVLCGLSVAEVSRALLVPEATMAKRLTRARAKIAAAGIPYRVPTSAELPDRLSAVATTLYLLFTEGYASLSPGEYERRELSNEAVRLGRLLVALMPGEAILEGLLATMLLQHSRRGARLNATGELVLLADQDRSRWDRTMADEGIDLAASAIRRSINRPERFAVTAAIAACHAIASEPSDTDWAAILAWYDVLAGLDPNPVVLLNRAAAVAESGDAARALTDVEAISGLDGYFWFHATRAELLSRVGQDGAALAAARRAWALTDSAVQHRFLGSRFPAAVTG